MPETAIVALFPELDPLLSGWLRRYTPSGARGLGPHVTLNVPFADSSVVGEHLAELAGELAQFAPFDIVLRSAARFPGTLYLAPEPAEPFVAMTEALGRAFPDFPPYGGEFDEIVPHLTIAQGDDSLLDAIEAELTEELPLETRVERVCWSRTRPPAGADIPDSLSNGANPCDSRHAPPRTFGSVREIDLAVYADALAGESSALSARAERIRSKLRQAKLERRARNDLSATTVDRLESLGLLCGTDQRAAHAELRELDESLAAVEELQAWIEGELSATNAA